MSTTDPATTGPEHDALPREFQNRALLRRGLEAAAAIGVLVLVALLAPGLGGVRHALSHASLPWLVVATAFEALSFTSYVVMFGPVFCRGLSWRRSWQIAGAELAMGSLVPASGAGGLALGAWILHRGGMDGRRIARRSVAFFLIKSSVNFFAVAILGTILALGLVGPDLSLWLTALPAALSVLTIAAVVLVPRIGRGTDPDDHESRAGRAIAHGRIALVDGTTEAIQIVRRGDVRVIGGAIGYWLFDNAVLWATFRAFGYQPALSIVLMGYLIGQLGGLLPIPGGVGGIDGGLIGTLVVYGTPAAVTAAAVLGYRLILFWLPLLAGAVAFLDLRRDMPREGELAACSIAYAQPLPTFELPRPS